MAQEDLFMQYVMRFGAQELPPRMQLPPERQTDAFMDALYARCLRENKPARYFITVEEEEGVLY